MSSEPLMLSSIPPPDEWGGPVPLASGGPLGAPGAAPACDLGLAPTGPRFFFDLVKIWQHLERTRQPPRGVRNPRGAKAPEAPAPQRSDVAPKNKNTALEP